MTNTDVESGISSISILSGVKISNVLDQHKGVGPGFDFIRLSLAVLIFYAHTKFALGAPGTNDLFQATQMNMTKLPTHVLSLLNEIKARLYVLAVPMFFALSGFLVTGSAIRLGSVKRFLGFRLLRILPALVVEVCLSAIVLGIFFSNLSIGEYLSNSMFWQHYRAELVLAAWCFLQQSVATGEP